MQWKATVDRFEGELAVLIPTDASGLLFTLDRSLLPPGTKAGRILKITIEDDPEATEAARDEIADLQEELSRMSRG